MECPLKKAIGSKKEFILGTLSVSAGFGLGMLAVKAYQAYVEDRDKWLEIVEPEDDIPEEEVIEEDPVEVEEEPEEERKYDGVITNLGYNKPDLLSIPIGATEKVTEEEMMMEELHETPWEMALGDDPVIISEDVYYNSASMNEKLVLYWWSDGVLTDDQYGMVDDIDGTIGPDALDNFGYDSTSDDVVHVRNNQKGIDFEILRVDDSFSETMAG